MTEHEKDRLAYEACGCADLCYDPVWERWVCAAGPDADDGELPLAPWSSADAAIAHAERGWFYLDFLGHWERTRGGDDKFTAQVIRDDRFGCGKGPSPGLAIRNAILAWKERNP